MTKYILSILIVFSISKNLLAQKEYNIWYFGNKAGLNFNANPPSILTDSKMYTFQSSTSMCDSIGNLLFYTNGDSIYNRNHKLMLNWKSTRPYAQVMSATQGTLALPVPGKSQLYYIFHGLSEENVSGFSKDSLLRYWVVDMTGDGGFGEVVVKDQPLFKARSENFAITFHSNGVDYWVGAVDHVEGNYNSTRSINGKFTSSIQKQKLNTRTDPFSRFIKFSPDSKILYSKESSKTTSGINNYYMNLFRFDNSNGQLSNNISIFVGNNRPNGECYAEFSPNSKFLYRPIIEGTNYNLYQYDISVWDSAVISNSKQLIFSINMNSNVTLPFAHLQLGPDKKIYCFQSKGISKNVNISVINNPDEKGSLCNFILNDIKLTKGENMYGGPYYPNFWFQKWSVNLGNDTTICAGDSLKLTCETNLNNKVVWNTGDTSNSIIVSKGGIYSVIVKSPKGEIKFDSLNLKIRPRFKVYLGSDTAFCGKFTYILNPKANYNKINWSTGDTTATILIDKPNWYSVLIKDSLNCASGDTILVEQLMPPSITLNLDTITCKYVYLSAITLSDIKYFWNTGDTGTVIKVDKKGYYSLTVSNKFCSTTTGIAVNKLPLNSIDLGKDTIICANEFSINCNIGDSILWSTGQKSKSIKVYADGKYWATSFSHGCYANDSILIKFDCDTITYFIPNAFSPTNDNLNETFRVIGKNIENVHLQIYNRWGEKLFEGFGKDVSWDGTYKSKDCQQDIYFYIITISSMKDSYEVRKTLSGSVTLLK